MPCATGSASRDAVLQFAFGGDDRQRLPAAHYRRTVVYTGTHDNDTAVGWWNSGPGADSTRTAADIEQKKDAPSPTSAPTATAIDWDAHARGSRVEVAHTALIPLQDVLGAGQRGADEPPGAAGPGNWGFRFTVGAADTRRLYPPPARFFFAWFFGPLR